jgi:hypothetical protein
MGFGTDGLTVMRVGANAQPWAHPASPTPAAQATTRQRREGSRPVGNSSTTNTHSPMAALSSVTYQGFVCSPGPRYGPNVPGSLRCPRHLMATALAGEPIPPGAFSGALTRNIS